MRYGVVWVALDEPIVDIPAFPEWDDASYRHVECPAYTWTTSAPRMVENFTDFLPSALDDMEKLVRERGVVQTTPAISQKPIH